MTPENKYGFLSDLNTRRVDNNKFELISPLEYRSKISIKNITVPTGFITNFASAIVVKFGERAATLHDYLYSCHKYNRSKCDKIYREALSYDGIGIVKRWSCYAAVRAFGWMHY